MIFRYFFLALALIASSLSITPSTRVTAAGSCPVGISHRGNVYYGSPAENSMGAFTAAYNEGGTWVETDLQFTADNVPVLMHDRDVSTTTNGTGLVSNLTAAQFTALMLKDGQHPPTLDQALDLIRTNSARKLTIEFKVGLTSTQEQILVQKLTGLENQIVLTGFDKDGRFTSVKNIKVAAPQFTIGLVAYTPVLPSPTGVAGQEIDYTALTATNVAQLKSQGVTVTAWTPNSSSAWNSLRDMGVTNITTNKLRDYLAWQKTTCPVTTPDPDVNPDPTPVIREYATNSSFESGITGWTSQATTQSRVSHVSGGYDGSYAIRAVNATTTTAKVGFASKPAVLDGVTQSTVAGKEYTASVWVKPGAVGQKLSIYLRENDPLTGSTVTSKTATITASTTNWQKITNVYVANGSGNSLAMHVFTTNAAGLAGFTADLVSLTSVE